MKDLISVFAYCPDNKRKKVLQDLLDKLKPLKDRFDILVISHSPISEISYDDIDYFYYDKNNYFSWYRSSYWIIPFKKSWLAKALITFTGG